MVIRGVNEAVLGTQTGEVRRAIVPPALRRRRFYSENFRPENTLVHNIELIRIVGACPD